MFYLLQELPYEGIVAQSYEDLGDATAAYNEAASKVSDVGEANLVGAVLLQGTVLQSIGSEIIS